MLLIRWKICSGGKNCEKNKENKANRTVGFQQKENEWKKSLANLFDIAHADAMKLMIIEEDTTSVITEQFNGACVT